MKRLAFLATAATAVLVLVLPFVGGGGPGFFVPAAADSGSAAPSFPSISVPPAPAVAEHAKVAIADDAAAAASTPPVDSSAFAQGATSAIDATTVVGGMPDWNSLAQAAEPQVLGSVVGASTCVGPATGTVGTAPATSSPHNLATGTTSADLASFANQYNAIRIANCLTPVPLGNFRYDSCMEARLFWMAESPSPDPADAWGHMGSTRSDGVPSTGCDGNLAGGTANTGATVATKWWDSTSHRSSLYRPTTTGSMASVCILFAMVHGGDGDASNFTRAAARWTSC